MSQRRLLLEDDPPPSADHIILLLNEMATLMHYRTDRGMKWYARATGGGPHGFSEANTAVEAMQMSLKEKQRSGK